MKTFFRILLFLLVLLTGISFIAFYWTFYRPLPDYNAAIELPALQQEVDIHWDTYGVPHIYASNEPDLYYALGYVHAQDRLWQMTLTQMAAEGRFAEFLGKDLLPIDRMQRTLGFWRIARQMEEELSDSSRRILQAYADGVNAYSRKNPKDLPIEFGLAGMEPIHWETTHTLALARLMAWELNLAWKSELNNGFLREKLSLAQFRELFPQRELYSSSQGSSGKFSDYAGVLLPLIDTDNRLAKILDRQGSHVGSNAWAVSAAKSDTDFPLLAGDPHLGLNMPGKWYEVHLNLNGKNLSGATLAGAPAVILGQNDHLAWSLTNVMLDDTDFFEEAVDPSDSGRYVLDTLAGEPLYEEFDIQREVIKIKGANDTTFTRRLTKHGPVISDIFPDQELVQNKAITIRWTGSEPSQEFDALLKMGWATSFEEFQEAIDGFKVPAQNLIYADTSGNIARFTLGNIPMRSGNPIALRKGWEPANDWQGYVPFEQLPRSINPNNGWVANANNPVGIESFPYYITVYWEPESRYNRIRQYLSQNDILTSEAFQVMQNDSYSDFSRQITEAILPVLKQSDDGNFSTAISYLENWDFKYEPSETAASIMDVFMLRFAENTLEDEMDPLIYENFIRFPAQPIRILVRFLQEGSSFFDDTTTETVESRSDIILMSMEETLSFLRENYGTEPFEWRWERLHTLTLEPPLFGRAAEDPEAPYALKLVVDNLLSKGPYPVRGNNLSINNGEYLWNEPYDMVLGASIRRIIDFSDMSKTLSILPTGQSGNPLSDYYGDQTDSWLSGQYKFLYQDSTFFNENQYRTMTLIPAQ